MNVNSHDGHQGQLADPHEDWVRTGNNLLQNRIFNLALEVQLTDFLSK